jgi:apolipoprotein N-acyltransferase
LTLPQPFLKNKLIFILPDGNIAWQHMIRQAGKSGSALLLTPANDWVTIKHIHAVMARTRAIENGLAILRPTSNGISIAVDPYGRIVSQVDYFQSRGGALTAVLPVKPVATLYSSLGDLFAWTVLIGTPFLLIVGMIAHKRRSKS